MRYLEDYTNGVFLDILPFNGASNGSNFSGSYVIESIITLEFSSNNSTTTPLRICSALFPLFSKVPLLFLSYQTLPFMSLDITLVSTVFDTKGKSKP